MHFYIDYTKIASTNSNPSPFGPVAGNLSTQYNCSSTIALSSSSAKAFTCIDGHLLVLPSDTSGLVNVVLKPLQFNKKTLPDVKYFIYRGLQISDFIVTNNLPVASSGNTDLIAKIWEDYAKLLISIPSSPSPNAKAIGYDTTIPNHTTLDSLFNGLNDVKPIYVEEGLWLGSFTGSIAQFQIVLSNDYTKYDLAFAKSSNTIIDVSAISDSFLKKLKREEILNFIDPAAFWGTFFNRGMNMRNDSKEKVNKTGTSLYNDIIAYYSTKNDVYIDIRNEVDSSYNFYENYNDSTLNNLKTGNTSASMSAVKYLTNEWPILINNSSISTTASFNNFLVQFRINENTNPVLFSDYEILSERFIEKDILLANVTTNDWTNSTKLSFNNITSGSQKKNIANYVRLYYIGNFEPGIDYSNLSATDKTTLQSSINAVVSASSLFSKLMTRLSSSLKKYTIRLDPNLAYGASFLPKSWGGIITFRTTTPAKYELIEEFFHAYQNLVYEDAYAKDIPINIEYEAKLFTRIVHRDHTLAWAFPSVPTIMSTIYSKIDNFSKPLVVDDLFSNDFLTTYFSIAKDFKTHYMSQTTTPSHYKKDTLQPPNGIIYLYEN